MKLIVGLGNPGEKYNKTRHNLGFIFLGKFQQEMSFSDWKYESKFTADISSGIIDGEKTLLVKPQTFMNLSGESIQKICHFYKLTSDDFIVLYDDISMDFGKVRSRSTGSAGGHNGAKDIIKHFGDNWKRIKVGVGSNDNYETSDWVLSKFTEEELIDLDNQVYQNIETELKKKLVPSGHSEGMRNEGVEESSHQNVNTLDPSLCSGGHTPKNIYLIGIGGIGVSAIARYYLSEGWNVSGSDSTDSELIQALKKEGCDIIIGTDAERLTDNLDLVVYTEAIPESQQELQKAKTLGIETQKYNVALGNIANKRKLIAVTGTHGKSTTSSIISLILKNSDVHFLSVVGTLLKEFDGKNFYRRTPENIPQNEYFAIEACEHKEHFLEYTPSVLVITNIEYDHADYFSTPADYLKAFEKLIGNVVPGGFVILPSNDTNAQKLIGLRDDIQFIEVGDTTFTVGDQKQTFPDIQMQVPGEHILFDAKLAYIVGHMAGISDQSILETLGNYSGVWRRMEVIGKTKNGNTLISDYGHHPTEIQVTLEALKKGFPNKKVFTVFQPHQYSRTIELLEGFRNCFGDTDILTISDIYESRDTHENKAKMNTDILVSAINHSEVQNGNGMENTLEIINQYDVQNPDSSIILLLGAGNIDNLRYKIKTS